MRPIIAWFIVISLVAAAVGAVSIYKFPDSIAGEVSLAAWEALQERSIELWNKAREAIKGGEEKEEVVTKQSDVPAELDQTPSQIEEHDKKRVLVEAGWRALEGDNRYSGPKIAGKDLKGKVVLVYVWNIDDLDSVKMLPRIEQIWQSFKHKKFVVFASHRGGKSDRVKRVAGQKKVTFSFYEDAGFVKEPKILSYPTIYVVDTKGKVVYHGKSDRSATEAVVESFPRQ